MLNKKQGKLSRNPFTIIEILVVIVIIIILAALLFPVIKAVVIKSKNAKTKAQLQTIMKALDEYKEYYGYYPIKNRNPCIIRKQTGGTKDNLGLNNAENWGGMPKYSSVSPFDVIWKDRWGDDSVDSSDQLIDPFENTFHYQCPGTMNKESYDLWSKGADGFHGSGTSATAFANAQNRDENDDITNWKSDFDE